MANEVKRMNYFNGLFLTEEEFNLEQNYHIRMRRLHNRSFHGWGIISGLEVIPGPEGNQVTVKPGMAINKVEMGGSDVGQEIILLEETVVDIPALNPGGKVYIYIKYKEQEEDKLPDRGLDKPIHVREKSEITASETKPVNEGENIILALVALDDDGNISIQDEEDGKPLRRYAGFSGKIAEMEKLILNVKDGTGTMASLEGKLFNEQNGIQINSPQTNFAGSLTVDGDFTVLGTTTTVKTETLEVEDNIIRVNKYDEQDSPREINGGLEVFRGGTAKNARIVWDEADDKWKIGLEGNLLDIAYGANWDTLTNNSIADDLHTHSKLVSGDGSADPALNVDNAGNVGIGTTKPAQRLDVNGTIKAASFVGSGFELDAASGDLSLKGSVKASAFYGGEATIKGKLSVSGDITSGGNLTVKGEVRATAFYGKEAKLDGSLGVKGTVEAASFKGDGSGLTGISAGKWSDGRERTIYYNDGNVGIGTTKPAQRLDVNGTIKAASFVGSGFELDAASGDLSLKGSVKASAFYGKEAKLDGNLGVKGTVEATAFKGDGSGLTGVSGNGSKWSDGREGTIYYNGGNVGIGTTKPETKLHVAGDIRFGATLSTAGRMHITGGEYLYLLNKSGVIIGREWGGSGNLTVGGNLTVDGSIGAGKYTGGAGHVNAYRMEIGGGAPNGKNGEATIFLHHWRRVAHQLRYTDGNLYLEAAGNGYGTSKTPNLIVGGNIGYSGTLTRTSSRELKENITDLSIQEAFEAVGNLNPVKFNIKGDEGRILHLGFIAEDTSDLVATPDKKAVTNDHIVAVLTKVVKDQQTTILFLQDEIKFIKGKIN